MVLGGFRSVHVLVTTVPVYLEIINTFRFF